MNPEILQAVREKGLLLEKDLFDILEAMDVSNARLLLDNIAQVSGQKMITKQVLNKNFEVVKKFVSKLENKEVVEKVFVKLGFSVEIQKESSLNVDQKVEAIKPAPAIEKKTQSYRIFYSASKNEKKLTVEDFVGNFRARYQQLQRILMQRNELQNLTSIGKIGSERKSYAIIGMLSEKRKTKNGNLILKLEDLTGQISVLIKEDKREVFEKADELMLDDIVGVKASGDREILFAQDIIFPDALIPEKMKFTEDISIAFVSDVHVGGIKHLERSFENFLVWLNGDDENAKKIKYIFFVGDNVDGVGIFPGQEGLLKLKSMEEQYAKLSDYLRRVPKHITMFMCPGQHDASRVAQPQPIISKKYAAPLYDIENLVLVSNPSTIKLLEGNREFKVLMYHGDSIHTFIHEIKELREMKAAKTPAKVIKHMLKRRHLDPFHSEAVYIPNMERDNLVIGEVPDVLCTGEMHRVDVENYNGIMIITGSCWQGQTSHEEKIGSIPDPCKVPILNLKTREFKILDFGVEEELNELHIRKM
jgi:DNA polymerase II small subunit